MSREPSTPLWQIRRCVVTWVDWLIVAALMVVWLVLGRVKNTPHDIERDCPDFVEEEP